MISNIFIPNEALRQKFKHQVDAAGISQLGVFGLVAAQTAYMKRAMSGMGICLPMCGKILLM